MDSVVSLWKFNSWIWFSLENSMVHKCYWARL